MNCNQVGKAERREVREQSFQDALKAVFLIRRDQIRSENRTLTKAKLQARWWLGRRSCH